MSMRMHSGLVLFAVVATVAGIAWQVAPAAAQGPACASERQSFCKGVPAGAGRILKCLQEHEDQLSDTCKEHLERRNARRERAAARQGGGRQGQARRANLREACGDEIPEMCPGARARRSLLLCLQEHEGELSDSCNEAVERMRGRIPAGRSAEARRRPQNMRRACRGEIRELCPEAHGREMILACLGQHEDALSPECKGFVVR